MKFVTFGNWSVRADRIVAVNLHQSAKCVSVYCGKEEEYSMFYKTQEATVNAHKKLMEDLEKIEIETLEELFDFVEQNGDCIISTETPYEENDKYFEAKGLTIYDDYI